MMKRFVLILAFSFYVSVQAQAQSQVPDCSNCQDATWNREWSPGHGQCAYNPISGCGNGCNCYVVFLARKGTVASGLRTEYDFFGGAMLATGFQVDRPGFLSEIGVKPGTLVYRINGRKPTKRLIASFNSQAPARGWRTVIDRRGRIWLTLSR
jgi:hypothetical protein